MPLEVQEAFLISKSERNALNQFTGFVTAKSILIFYQFIMAWWYLRSWQPRISYISYKVLGLYARIDPGSIPGSRRSLEKEMATHSSILAWKIPWMVKPGRLPSKGSQRIGHDWVTSLSFLCKRDDIKSYDPYFQGLNVAGSCWMLLAVFSILKYFYLM